MKIAAAWAAWAAAAAAVLVLAAMPATASPLADLVAGKTAASPELAGLAIVVADRTHVLRREGYGRAVIDPGNVSRQRPLTAETPVRVASISKLVVAIAVMRLVEQGRLDLDQDVSAYLGWTLRNPAHADVPITLRRLLSHTSSLIDGPGYRLPLGTALRDNLGAAHWAPTPAGSHFAYANLNYGVIATVMEAATGERFDRLMTRLVLAPLSLDAGYNWSGASDAAVAGAAVLYRKGADEAHWASDGPWVAQVDDRQGHWPACPVASDGPVCDLAGYVPGGNGTLFSPQGGLRISALGLARIGQMLLRGGEIDGVRILAPASVRALMTPVWRAGPGDADGPDNFDGLMRCYGPGLHCLAGGRDQPLAGRTLHWWGHSGEAYGLYGGLWVDHARGRVFVFLMTGSADDPMKAPHRSAFSAAEEAIVADLVRTR